MWRSHVHCIKKKKLVEITQKIWGKKIALIFKVSATSLDVLCSIYFYNWVVFKIIIELFFFLLDYVLLVLLILV